MKNILLLLCLFSASAAVAQEEVEAPPEKPFTEVSAFGGCSLFNIERRTAGVLSFAAAIERRKVEGFGFGLRAATMRWKLIRENSGTTGKDASGYPPAGYPFVSRTEYNYGRALVLTPFGSYNWDIIGYEMGLIVTGGVLFTDGSGGQDYNQIDATDGGFRFQREHNYGANVGLTGGAMMRLGQHLSSRLNLQLQGGFQISKMLKAGSEYSKAVFFPIELGLAYGFR